MEEDSEGRCQSTMGRLELDDEHAFQRDHLGDHLGHCQLVGLHSWRICSSMEIGTLGCDETCFLEIANLYDARYYTALRGCATDRRGALSGHLDVSR